MLKMKKGNREITIPNTTKSIYENMGYKEIVDEILEDVQPEVEEVEDQIEEVEDYTDKPIADWTTAELKDFVSENKIDLKGAKKTPEVREIVKAYLLEV